LETLKIKLKPLTMNNLKQLLPTSQSRLEQIRLNKFRQPVYDPKPVMVTPRRTVKDNTFLTACFLLAILVVFTVYKIATS